MRVVDSRGLPLTTTAAAAGHYRDGVDAWLRVQEGFGPAMLAARREDPGFALAAAGLALDAAVQGGRDRVLRAMRSHPLVLQQDRAEHLTDLLLAQNAKFLPWAS